MSAIGAIFSGEDEAGGMIARGKDVMLRSLSQVPHDDAHTWQGGPMVLAAATLHTTGDSREARQPVTSADGAMAAVFDGFLLNPAEIARDCAAKGCAPRNRSDVEIALAAYRAWGEGCAVRLEGEFAFIVADKAAGRLFAARDHMGLVPLYYRREGARLTLASDYRTLLALSRTPPEPNRDYLAQVVASRWFLREATPWHGIERIVRAHYLTYDGDRPRTANYWVPPTDVTIRYRRDEDYADHYRELLFDCVKRASRSDRMVGTAVSGGLDSTALFCVAERLDRNGELLAPGIRPYTFTASEGSNAFELPYARTAARHVGRELKECPLFEPDAEWYAGDAARYADIPVPSNGAMMLGIDRQVVVDGCRVLINGNGGDEWLQGSEHYYREFVAERDPGAMMRALHRDARRVGWRGALGTAGRHALAELAPGPLRSAISARLKAVRGERRDTLFWLARDLRAMLRRAEAEYDRMLPDEVLPWMKHNLARSPFSDLANSLMYRQRAAIGLQSRHPMLSRRFIEFATSTPAHIKRRAGVGKFVHRMAMKGIVPDEVLQRRSKANFTNAAIDAQFADYVRRCGTTVLPDLCNMEGVAELLQIDFATPEGDLWAWEIWGLYASAVFLYNYRQMDAAHAASAHEI